MYMWMDVCAYVCMCIFTHSYVYIRIITYDKKGKEKTYVIYTHEALILGP
jgi:ribulose bisphosphate carboxylase small subunit